MSAASRQNNRGFTLLELVLVLGLIAAAGVVLLPLVLRFSPQTSIDRAAEQMMAQLNGARMEAMRQNRVLRLMAADLMPPAGFRLTLPAGGVDFAPDGFSAGARLKLEGPDGAWRSLLVEPVSGRVRLE
jgi:prepilin-type N-terminal cleavage/methylation domain-containing protein